MKGKKDRTFLSGNCLADSNIDNRVNAHRAVTIRQRIIEILKYDHLTAKEISKSVSITERDVIQHLPHIAKSLSAKGNSLSVKEPQCLDCGFLFRERSRFSRPGHCPRCKGTHISEPAFGIVNV